MNEITFIVEDAPEGGYTAWAVDHSIFTEADTREQLYEAIREAVQCYFDEGTEPRFARLHYNMRDDVVAVAPPIPA